MRKPKNIKRFTDRLQKLLHELQDPGLGEAVRTELVNRIAEVNYKLRILEEQEMLEDYSI